VLSERVLWIVSALAAPIGIVALIVFGNTGDSGLYKVDLGDWNTSSWTMVTQSWAGLVLLALSITTDSASGSCAYVRLSFSHGRPRFQPISRDSAIVVSAVSIPVAEGKKMASDVDGRRCDGSVAVFSHSKLSATWCKTGAHFRYSGVANNMIADVTSGHSEDRWFWTSLPPRYLWSMTPTDITMEHYIILC